MSTFRTGTLSGLFYLLALSHTTLAAPIPATSTSEFLQTGIGLFRSPLGFSISSDKTNWLHIAPPENQKNIATLYKAPKSYKGVQALLSVRVDELESSKTLNQYMREWVKVYPRLGFNILGTKKINLSKQEGFLIDLIHSKSQRQVRQVVFLNEKNAYILSCRGHQDEFKLTVKSCNQIMRNFTLTSKGVRASSKGARP